MAKKTWTTEGFDAFRRGTFGNGGHNLYVSKSGTLQRIFQYDLDRNGYVDLVFANCQNHGESAPTYAYTLDGNRVELPAQGAVCGMAMDVDGDGYIDIITPGRYDMVSPYASTDIYFGSPEGYSEKYHIRIPTPWATDCCSGKFRGESKPTLVFTMPRFKTLRIFEQERMGCLEWNQYRDIILDYEVSLITACDLDGDGYDELIIRADKTTETRIFWGGPEGIQADNFTVLPELPKEEILQAEEQGKLQSEMEKAVEAPRLLQSVVWNGKNCFTLSTGKKMIFFTADKDRNLYRELEFPVLMAQAVAIGDLSGNGYDDIAIAAVAKNEQDLSLQESYIVWNGPEGFDKTPRTVINTRFACHVGILDDKVLFVQGSQERTYTNDSLLFTYPDFENPQRFEGEDTRRGELIRNPDGQLWVVLHNHYSRSAIGFDKTYIYWGSKDGYSPENMQAVPSHCAVDSLIADFNDDGWAELLVGNNSENAMHLDVGHHMHYFGPNGFEPEKSHNIKADIGWGVVAGDFDHDGYLEIATSANMYKEIRIFSARDNFTSYQVIPLKEGVAPRWPAAVDLNNDGWLDLIVPGAGKNTFILWGGPEGFSIERSQELSSFFIIGATAADLTKNGYPDLILGGHTQSLPTPNHPHHSFVHIYWNGPEGIKESRKTVLRGDAADHMAVADFNNDGWLDIFAGSYHGGKDRDINSFLYWNREGHFSEKDRQLLFTHSASGCLAADFNEDGYIDLAVANHKVDGDHHGYSTVWWNGPNGFNSERTIDLPSNGPHGMISTEVGNIMDRSFSEYYYSEAFTADKDYTVTAAKAYGDVPEKTAVNITVRVNEGDWTEPGAVAVKEGDKLEYRAELYAYNGLRTPRIHKIDIELTEC